MITKQVSQFSPVLAVLVDTQLQVLSESVIELVIVLFVLCNLVEHLNALFSQFFLITFRILFLLQHLTGDVKGQVIRIHNTFDKSKVLGNELFTVIHDEDPSDIEFLMLFIFLRVSKRSNGALLGTKRIALNSS
ncbi:UNVERIFIED_CONTAM: hypothetical protein Sradi_1958100 [Sesamum radiatum]|uniref:Uncharacterized protein n=1 Tax=Sesamum radiatum TaxID=300843 RepID=A0AAW2TG88_SESRA